MPVFLSKIHELQYPQVGCSCGKIVYEMDTMNCACCGDVMCQSCYTDCFDCGKMYCKNCSESHTQCLKCHLDKTLNDKAEKAYLVIGKESRPIRNAQFMIDKSALPNARDIRLTLEGKTYKYCYRALQQRSDDKMKFDYFLHFEEEKTLDDLARHVREALSEFDGEDYDDYGTNWLGW
jgi:hypothetical protein